MIVLLIPTRSPPSYYTVCSTYASLYFSVSTKSKQLTATTDVRSISFNTRIADPQAMESQSNDCVQVQKGADSMQGAKLAVKCLHLFRHPRLIIGLPFLFLQFVPLEHCLASHRPNNKVIDALSKYDRRQGVRLGNISNQWTLNVGDYIGMGGNPKHKQARPNENGLEEVNWENSMLQCSKLLSRECPVRDDSSKECDPKRRAKNPAISYHIEPIEGKSVEERLSRQEFQLCHGWLVM